MKTRSRHEPCADGEKSAASSVQQEQLGKSSDEVLKTQKIFYDQLTAVAKRLESEKASLTRARRVVPRAAKPERRHMDQRIRDAETFAERDKLLRDLAAYCYNMAKEWAKQGDAKAQLAWMKLLARFLSLAQKPAELVQIEEELDELERRIKKTERTG